MTDNGEMPRVTVRLPEEQLDEIDETAEKADLSRSEVIRRNLAFASSVEGAQNRSVADVEADIDQIIEQNQTLRRVLPSHWRDKVEGLFATDLRADPAPAELRLTAEAYRNQAEALEELAEMHPMAPEADLVSIVDDVLIEALEAADLSNYYEQTDNRFEKELSGVQSGADDRREAIPVIQGAMRISNRLLTASNKANGSVTLDADDLPEYIDLPDAVDRQDVAEIANEMNDAGVDPEDVPDELRPGDPRLSGDDPLDDAQAVPSRSPDEDDDQPEIEHTPSTDAASEPLTLEVAEDEQEPDEDGPPLTDSNGEAKQARLVSELPAADGGRETGSIPGSDTMNSTTETTDSNDTEPTAATEGDHE